MSRNISIAKNTLFLYFRMICIMVVSLYTSRVVLNVLGATNYGIYHAVCGVVGMLSFINNALATGSSRFLTFELGKGVSNKLKAMFTTLLLTHILLATLIIFIGEPVGLWYIGTQLNLAEDQEFTAKIIYQFSLATAFMNITQVPYSAIIIAHENMKIYAYVSLIEALLKLSVAFVIRVSPIDKLVFYAALLCVIQFMILMIYRIYCRKNYCESKFLKRAFDRKILKEVFGFSGWSMLSSISYALIQNGTVLLLTSFFSPALAASRAIADQVNNAVNQFINNFRTAANPQIVKRYAAEDFEGSKKLLLKSTCFSYYLMLFISLPVILLSRPLIYLWLGQIPEFVVPFLQWSMVQGLFAVFDASLYVPLYAKGRLKENALIAPSIDMLCLLAVYIGFLYGSSPLIICYAYVVMAFIQGLIEKPILLCLIVGYDLNEMTQMFKRCFWVTLIAVPVPCYIAKKIDVFQVYNFLIICIVSSLVIAVVVWSFGMEAEDRVMVRDIFKSKLKRIDI